MWPESVLEVLDSSVCISQKISVQQWLVDGRVSIQSVFQRWSLFFNVVMSTQSSTASSKANHELRPSNPGGIFGVDCVKAVTLSSAANVYSSSSSIASFLGRLVSFYPFVSLLSLCLLVLPSVDRRNQAPLPLEGGSMSVVGLIPARTRGTLQQCGIVKGDFTQRMIYFQGSRIV